MNDCRDFDLLVARALGLGLYFLYVPVLFCFVFSFLAAVLTRVGFVSLVG